MKNYNIKRWVCDECAWDWNTLAINSDEYSEEEGSKEDESGTGLKVKEGRKLNQKELKLIETASSLRAKSKNPKCKALFRSEQKDKTTNYFLNILQLQEFSSCHKVQ